jgi:hypothetical protein
LEGSFPVNGNVKQTPEQSSSELEKKKDAEIERDILKSNRHLF